MSPASKINAKGFRSVVELNFVGSYLMMRAAYDNYMGYNGGSIVNILANFENGFVFMSHIGASLAAVPNLSLTLNGRQDPG
jgi:NAD(P)-dependent dehydrogenase (short-subunit alcohol dehydrogenase family)